MKISLFAESILTNILLIALIVLVIFAIILVARLIGTTGRVNVILDDSTKAVTDIKEQVVGVISDVREKGRKASAATENGISTVKKAFGKASFRKK